MSIIFWKPANRTTDSAGPGAVVVSEEDPLPVGIYVDGVDVSPDHPLPTKEVNEPGYIKGVYYESLVYEIPGVVAGVAYGALDGLGTQLFIPDVPSYWRLTQIDILDPSDQGAALSVYLANAPMGVTSTDNNALVIGDEDLHKQLGAPIAIAASSYGDLNTGQIGGAKTINQDLYTPRGLYVQVQAVGTPTVTAGAIPKIRFKGLQ